MPTVFVMGMDWTMRAAVRAELRERGVEALAFASFQDVAEVLPAGQAPVAVVLDGSSRPLSQCLHRFAQRARCPGILVMACPQEELPAEVRSRPAVTLRQKPPRIAEVVSAVRHLLEGHAAWR